MFRKTPFELEDEKLSEETLQMLIDTVKRI